MSHFDGTPSGLHYTLITIRGIFSLPQLSSNCFSVDSCVEKMLRDIWTLSVSALSPLLGEALIWLRFPDKWRRGKGGGAESGTLLNILSPGSACFVKAETSPWPNQIKCFEGWQVQSVSGWLLLNPRIQFRRKTAGLKLLQMQKKTVMVKNCETKNRIKLKRHDSFVHMLSWWLPLFIYLFIFLHHKNCTFHHSSKTISFQHSKCSLEAVSTNIIFLMHASSCKN